MKRNSKQQNLIAFKRLARKINELISRGEWENVAKSKQLELTRLLAYYFGKIRTAFAKRRLSRILGAACVLFSVSATAQTTFGPRQDNPFGTEIVEDSYIRRVAFGDLDNDGDLDLITSKVEYGWPFVYQENTGTPEMPAFTTSEENPFGLTASEGMFFTNLVDIDDDGDLDLFVTNYYGVVIFYENIGTIAVPSFDEPVENPFGLTATSYNFLTATADLDGDGDYDFIFTTYDDPASTWSIAYSENSGTAESATFEASETTPFGLDFSSEDVQLVDFADLDNDGDLDLMRSSVYGTSLFYHENTGTEFAPAFASGDGVTDPFDLEALDIDSYFVHPTFADIDDDGDSDLFVAGYYGETFFFENLSLVIPSCEGDIEVETTDVTCFDGDDGAMAVTVDGGLAPLSFDIGDGPVATGLFIELEAGEYTLVVTDGEGCIEEETVVIGSPDPIDATSIVVPETVGNDGEIDITVVGGTGDYTYEWSGPDGFTSTDGDLTGLATGDYVLIIRDDNGCEFETLINVGSTASIGENKVNFKVYPNPSSGIMNIDYSGDQLISIQVIDMTGRVVLSDLQIDQGSNYLLNMADFEDGTYLMELNLSGSKQIKRIVKK